MASTIILRRATASTPFSKLTNSIRSAPSVSRSLNTDTQVTTTGGDDGSGSVELDRRSCDGSVARRRQTPPSSFSNVFDPFSPTRILTQVVNLMDQFMDNPFMATRGMGVTGSRRGFDVKEDKDALYICMDMPGLSKDDVKVTVEGNTLVIKGEQGGKESEEGEEESGKRRYSSRLELPSNVYKLDEIKGQMKNGVLKLVLPKLKEAERKDVHGVKVE